MVPAVLPTPLGSAPLARPCPHEASLCRITCWRQFSTMRPRHFAPCFPAVRLAGHSRLRCRQCTIREAIRVNLPCHRRTSDGLALPCMPLQCGPWRRGRCRRASRGGSHQELLSPVMHGRQRRQQLQQQRSRGRAQQRQQQRGRHRRQHHRGREAASVGICRQRKQAGRPRRRPPRGG